MNPYETIERVLWVGEALYGFDPAGVLVAELDEEGLADLRALRPGLKVEVRARQQFMVRAVTTQPVFLAKDASPRAVGGVHLSIGQMVLVAGQTDPVQNGLYIVQAIHNTDGAWWLRCAGQPAWGDLIRVGLDGRSWTWVGNGVA